MSDKSARLAQILDDDLVVYPPYRDVTDLPSPDPAQED